VRSGVPLKLNSPQQLLNSCSYKQIMQTTIRTQEPSFKAPASKARLPIEPIITENDTPVDNFPSAKQQRLLIESLYNAWTPPDKSQHFIADANIGIFSIIDQPPIVPDVFLSLDVQVAEDWWDKRHRSYFIWEFGKPPDVVIEIVSNTLGDEAGRKLHSYARMRVPYYVIFDPKEQLGSGDGVLRLYELRGFEYVEMKEQWLPQAGLGLTLWDGVYENKRDNWLRWCDQEGKLILTGGERAELERQEKEQALSQLEHERKEKEQALSQLEEVISQL
jgi:Uma2 family endonuclease